MSPEIRPHRRVAGDATPSASVPRVAVDRDDPVVSAASPGAVARRATLPRQHGAWAMLATPLLPGVAASQPAAWQRPQAPQALPMV